MYSIISFLALFGMFMYFVFPIILGSLIFVENKGLFFDKPLKERKICISLFALIVGLIAVSSIIVSFENEVNVFLRAYVIISSITYSYFTICALRVLLKTSIGVNVMEQKKIN